METLTGILDVAAVILIILAVLTFLASMGGEAVSMIVSPVLTIAAGALMGLSLLCHVEDEKKREFAVAALKEQNGNLLINEYRDELDIFYLSATDISRNREKIQRTISNLRGKSEMLTNDQARQVLDRKIEQLEKQRKRLDKVQQKLEQYAYEQLLVNFAGTLKSSGMSVGANFSQEVQRELETVKAVMAEVETISKQ